MEKRCSSEKNTWIHTTKTRLELLKLYKKSMSFRVNWENIDSEVILEHVNRLITAEG